MRGHVGAVSVEHRGMGAPVQDRLRQVSYHATRQRRHRRSAAGGIFPARPQEEGGDQREEVVAVESLEEPDAGTPRGIEPVVPIEPAGLQGLPAERELREAVELPLQRGHAQLPEPVDGATEVAATGSVRETRGDAPEARGRHRQLLRDQSSLWRSRGRQWEYSHADQPGPRLQEPAVSAAEGQTDCGDECRIHRTSQPEESRVKWHLLRILAQSPKMRPWRIKRLFRTPIPIWFL